MIKRCLWTIVAAGAVLLSSCSSSSKPESRSVTIEEFAGGNGVRVTVSETLARSVLEGVLGTEIECGAELDPEIEAVLRELDREGRGSRVVVRDRDTALIARRSGRSLKLDFDDADGSGLEARMPWAVAECLLDGSATLSAHDLDAVRVKLTGDGGGFELAVD